MIPRLRRLAPLLVAALATGAWLGCASPKPSRQLFQWTDADGNVRYTPFPDRVPVGRQSTRRVVEPGASAIQNAAAPPPPAPTAPTAPTATPAPTATSARSAAAPAPVVGAPDGSDLDARIAAVEAQVASDEEALKTLISDPERARVLHGSDELQAIAQRLPRLQAELARLRAEREAAASAAPGSAGVP